MVVHGVFVIMLKQKNGIGVHCELGMEKCILLDLSNLFLPLASILTPGFH